MLLLPTPPKRSYSSVSPCPHSLAYHNNYKCIYPPLSGTERTSDCVLSDTQLESTMLKTDRESSSVLLM